MYNTLYRLYTTGKLSLSGLGNAVTRGWIAEEQYKEISGEDYM
jgi:hypothetical protein